jgi:multiple sugar transport system substrate-binding protein
MGYRRSCVAVLVLVLLLGTACGPAAPSATVSPEAATALPTTGLTGPVSWMVSGDPAETQAFQDVAEAFEAENPGADVTLITVASDEEAYHVRLAADMAAGTPADVVFLDYRDAGPFYANGSFQPITGRLAASSQIHEDDFYPQAVDAFRWQDELMCLPINISSLVVYYNQDMFSAAGLDAPAAGWTWDDFLAAAQALTQDTDGDGVTDQYGVGSAPQLVRVLPFVWQNGGDFLSADGTQAALDQPAAAEAVQFFVDLQARHHVAPGEAEERSEASADRFVNGRLGMFLSSRRSVPGFRAITAFTWDVAPLPQRAQAATILHSDGLCLPTKAAHPDLGWRLLEFAVSPQGQALMAATGRTVPSSRAVAESPAFLDPDAKPAHSRVWLDVVPTLRAAPVLAEWPEIEERANEELEAAFYGHTSADEAISAIAANTTRFLAP